MIRSAKRRSLLRTRASKLKERLSSGRKSVRLHIASKDFRDIVERKVLKVLSEEEIPKARVTVRFGDVVVEGVSPGENVVTNNIIAGQKSLERASKTLLKAGVQLGQTRSIPLYSADPERSGIIVRELAGRKEKGKFIDGRFVAES